MTPDESILVKKVKELEAENARLRDYIEKDLKRESCNNGIDCAYLLECLKLQQDHHCNSPD